jgi:predicted RNA-binding Zn ribbon-like protein
MMCTVTGQVELVSYEDTGIVIAVDLVNGLAIEHAWGRPASLLHPFIGIHKALEVDPPTVEQLRTSDVPGFVALAPRLRAVFTDLHQGDVDTAAGRLNELLAAHSAHPHLAKEDGRWRLHHHPADAALIPMVTAICAEALARQIGANGGRRLGTCGAADCDRVFRDTSKNASRRFCSTTCQNRVKAATYRRRHGASKARDS